MFGRLMSLLRRRRLDSEMELEFRYHLDSLEAEHRASGLSAKEARQAALRDFGGLTRVKEAYQIGRAHV